MSSFNSIRLPIMLAIAGIAACSNADRDVQVEPKHVSDVERSGQAFREKLLTQSKNLPAQSFKDMAELCRETFNGRSLQEANAMMRGAGQAFDLIPTNQPAVLTPPGTTPYAGGFGLHSTFISSASFNISFYAINTGSPARLIVKDVSCGIKELSL